MDDSTRFTWQSIEILILAVLVCVLGLALYSPAYIGADAIRGFLTSVLAAAASLLLFYWVDPRMKSKDPVAELKASGINRVAANHLLGHHYWLDLLAGLPSAENDAFIVGKRLTDWRVTQTYASALLTALNSRSKRACECLNSKKYRTYVVVEDNQAHSKWKMFLEGLLTPDSRLELLHAPAGSVPYGLGKR